ncbi:hypothetical protein BAY61_01185 [Prauserella marina]|uniref:Uncharacterized protein n=1 Tax=Prauserella marina TaxID=530584 RepID=A0A222VIS8_9PSEU|nr:DUF2188 domain-containing protein [Prauserella marina]ASR33829.1 hypothetical protein BAY61_01185 [Prauserella marina]PWV82412.1 uncharacterized protein DUF2188 [Prauserella marina]SDC68535.1 hypothetical protein SAMN05421630_103189 [Prauserella marina]
MRRSCFSVQFVFSPDSLTWLVKRDDEVLSRHCRKREAVSEAARVARADIPSVLVISRMDGTLEGERRYGFRRKP